MTIRAVFFDAGHTILHPDPPVGEIYAREAVALGARVTVAELEPVFIEAFQQFIRDYAPAMDVSDEQERAMWHSITRSVYDRVPALQAIHHPTWFERLFEVFGHASVWRLYPDVETTLEALRARGMRLGVISNWDTRLRTIVREMGIERRFDRVVISAEEGVRKPDRRIFERALAALGVQPHEAIHVGDLVEDDVVGARGAGMRGILIDRGRFKPPADVEVVQDLGGLLQLINPR